MRFEGCVKIHLNCGGVIRWVEAIETPGIGFTGECRFCDEDSIPVERMIPLAEFDHSEVFQMDRAALADLRWQPDLDWETNQTRLTEEVRRHAE